MKKILFTMGIASIFTLALIGVLVWRASSVSKDITKENSKQESWEKDILSSDGSKALDDIEERKVVPLYLKGVEKNVISYKKEGIKEIYNIEKSSKIAEQLANLRELSDYSFEKPLISYNPYGTLENSLYISFHTKRKSYIKYTVTVEDKDIPDFNRSCLNLDGDKLTKEHQYTLVGLVPGMKNYIVMRLYNHHDEVLEEMVYSITMPEDRYGSSVKLSTEKGRSRETISNGLYTVCAHSGGGKKKKEHCIALYDNSGILRGEIPLLSDCAGKITYVYDNMFYACDSDRMVQVSAAGQVMHAYDMPNYTLQGGYTYDGYGNVFAIVSKNGRKSINDVVMEIGLTTGKVEEVLDFTRLLDKVYEAAKPVKGEKKLNWIDLNDIQVTAVNRLLVSSRELSSIIKVNNLHSKIPLVSYIIADEAIWKASASRKKLLDKSYKEGEEPEETESPVESILEQKPEKKEVFRSQFGQSQILLEKSSSLEEGQFYLYVLNNNYGEWKTRPAFSFKRYKNIGTEEEPAAKSYYYKFLVDETARTYYFEDSVSLPYIQKGGSVQEVGGHYVVADSDDSYFLEFDVAGKTLIKYDFDGKLIHVEKEGWKGFWFR